MKFFEKRFKQLLDEDMTAGAGGVFGDAPSMGHGGAVGNTDFYAPGDMRIPKGGKKKARKKKKNKKTRDVGVDMLIQTQRRPLIKGL
jgi:hypothetical protein